MAIDIAGPVSPTADAIPATEAELEETVADIRHYGRRAMAIKADIRDIAALRRIADEVEAAYARSTSSLPTRAIQGWKPLMEMNDNDWRDQIDNNLNGTANTVRAFGPKMVARNKGRFILLASMQGRMGHEGWRRLLRVEVGHSRADEVRCVGARRLQYHRQRHLPGLVGTALTHNEQRYRAAIAQSNRATPAYPTAQETWDARTPTVPLGVGWLQPERHISCRRLPRLGRGGTCNWSRVRRDRGRRRQGQLAERLRMTGDGHAAC